MPKMTEMTDEELVSYRDDCFEHPYYNNLTEAQTEAHKELLIRLAAGREAMARVKELEKEVERLKATAVCIYCNKIMVADNGKDKLSMMIDHMSLCDKHPMYKIGNLLIEIDRLKSDKRELVEALEQAERRTDALYDATFYKILTGLITKHKEDL